MNQDQDKPMTATEVAERHEEVFSIEQEISRLERQRQARLLEMARMEKVAMDWEQFINKALTP